MKPVKFMEKKSMVKWVLIVLSLATASGFVLAEQQFPTREAAVDAMVKALSSEDQPALGKIFGPDYVEFQAGQESDPALQNLRTSRFLAAYQEFHAFVPAGENRNTLVVGSMAWPFPIPLVQAQGSWYFDGTAGVEELRNRIVGANELNAIASLDMYAAAQSQYSQNDHDGDGVLEYAQRVVSTPGTRDGLYWETDSEGGLETPSPLDLLKRLADALLGEREQGSPFLGYHFRVLFSQGEYAKAGAYEYMINGHLLGGYAMLAWPAEYGETGVMSFIVNQDRVIYQKDFGNEAAGGPDSVTSFNPGPGWEAVPDEEFN